MRLMLSHWWNDKISSVFVSSISDFFRKYLLYSFFKMFPKLIIIPYIYIFLYDVTYIYSKCEISENICVWFSSNESKTLMSSHEEADIWRLQPVWLAGCSVYVNWSPSACFQRIYMQVGIVTTSYGAIESYNLLGLLIFRSYRKKF